jgi:urea transport system substrate-binding protein
MAISETTLRDVMLMLIEEQNKKGGVLGRPLEAVVVDPPPTGRSSPSSRAS